MINLQYKGQQLWVASQKEVRIPAIKLYKDIQMYVEASNIQELLEAYEAFMPYTSSVKYNADYVTFNIPSSRSTANLKKSFYTPINIQEHIDLGRKLLEEILKFKDVPDRMVKECITKAHKHLSLDCMRALTDLRRDYPVVEIYANQMLASLNRLTKMINSGVVEVMAQSVEAGYIKKSAWAIFAEKKGESGFVDKDGILGEISSARLFDSDKAALRSAGGNKNCEIMEVEIVLKGRTNLKPEFKNSKMLEALAYMEREKLAGIISSDVSPKKHKL